MSFFIYLVVFTSFTLMGVIVLLLRVERRVRLIEEEMEDECILSSYEVERIEREGKFDARINKLKEDIALKQVEQIHTDNPAIELHPDVHNLPHDVVRQMGKYEVEEYAD